MIVNQLALLISGERVGEQLPLEGKERLSSSLQRGDERVYVFRANLLHLPHVIEFISCAVSEKRHVHLREFSRWHRSPRALGE